MLQYRFTVLPVALWICAAASVAAFNGCSATGLPGDSGTVSGRITYQGGAVPAGTIVSFIHIERGLVGSAACDEEGKFALQMREAPNILVGEYQVSVTPPPESFEIADALSHHRPLTPAQKAELMKEWKEIPEPYRLPETSGQKFTVQTGHNEYQLDMKPAPAGQQPREREFNAQPMGR